MRPRANFRPPLGLAVLCALLLSPFAYYILHALTMTSANTTAAPSPTPAPAPLAGNLSTATFAGGCFWCTEAVYQRLDGVVQVTCGFTGGTVKNPSYEDVCTGETGHAEAVQIRFDPKKITYDELLDWFWRMHDPTTLNRQGADTGTQYRSAIFYANDAQRAAAEKSKAEAQKSFAKPIVTQIVPAGPFYSAEQYHQDYFNQNSGAGYCQIVIAPKLRHLGLDDSPDAKPVPATSVPKPE